MASQPASHRFATRLLTGPLTLSHLVCAVPAFNDLSLVLCHVAASLSASSGLRAIVCNHFLRVALGMVVAGSLWRPHFNAKEVTEQLALVFTPAAISIVVLILLLCPGVVP